MLQILNLQEANNYTKNNLSTAVEKGLLKQIDKKHFAVVKTEHKESGCTWLLDEIIRLSDEEMKELDLYCRY